MPSSVWSRSPRAKWVSIRSNCAARISISPSAMPYTNAVGQIYDSGEYRKNMDRALEIADWDGFEKRREDAAARGKLLGRGFANYVESSIGNPKERAEIEVKPRALSRS